ncbi:hypothetical protein S245_011939, partial [Arachis hypogaea]
MPSHKRLVVLLSLTTLLLFSSFTLTSTKKSSQNDNTANENDDEDLSFLEEPDEAATTAHHRADSNLPDPDGDDEDLELDEDDDNDYGDFSSYSPSHFEAEQPPWDVDDKDVVVLKERNFTTVIENNQYVMVEFYAPWCGHCQALAPEYAAAATELKNYGVVLAKIDATAEQEMAHEYDVQGFPSIFFFVDGEHKPYTGHRTKDGIVTWVKKKIGPGVYNISTADDAERILTSENKVVLAFLTTLVGSESEELAAASKLEDNREDEKLSYFDGKFVKAEIADFVAINKLALVTTFSKETAPLIFESKIKKQLLLFVTKKNSDKFFPIFGEAAKLFKGK